MGPMLDRTEQRIVGVLVEASLLGLWGGSLSESEVRFGCNQFDSRDPLMELTEGEIAAALAKLQEKGWVERMDCGPRGLRCRSRVAERFSLQPHELALLCQLVLFGPQTATALEAGLSRFGSRVDGRTLETALHELASRPQPLCAPLSPGLRGGERLWTHLWSNRLPDRLAPIRPTPVASSSPAATAEATASGRAEPSPAAMPSADVSLSLRVEELEKLVSRLTADVRRLQAAHLDDVMSLR